MDAILGKHEGVINVLVDNGAKLDSGDVGEFACHAAKIGDIELLKEITKFNGNVMSLSGSGTTALHTAIDQNKVDTVKFLIEIGADIDIPDSHGWTPRTLAHDKGREEIMALFDTIQHLKKTTSLPPLNREEAPYFKKHASESSLARVKDDEDRSSSPQTGASSSLPRYSVSDFQKSLAGIITSGGTPSHGKFVRLITTPSVPFKMTRFLFGTFPNKTT